LRQTKKEKRKKVMLAIYSPDHQYQNPQFELIDGKLSLPFEKPQRVEKILTQIRQINLGQILPAQDFDLSPILRVHDESFVHFLQTAWEEWALARPKLNEAIPYTWMGRGRYGDRIPQTIDGKLGYYAYDAGTPITSGTWQAAISSANVALTAQDLIFKGEKAAFALCRPPGHHASRDCYGGYCFFNNAAIAAQAFRDAGASIVAILDVDYHHGNGTQAIFYERRDVLFVSLHADPAYEYPYFFGYDDESGIGEGEGYNRNYPLSLGTNWATYRESLDDAINSIARYNPDILVVSLGVDTFREDPICQFQFNREDYLRLGEAIATVKKPTLFVMEGGYAIDELGFNVVNVLQGFENAR
jgi:acetoin utilization deacetylase AcuC-like enzyme